MWPHYRENLGKIIFFLQVMYPCSWQLFVCIAGPKIGNNKKKFEAPMQKVGTFYLSNNYPTFYLFITIF